MDKYFLKMLVIFFILLLIVNIILLALRKINEILFWFVIIAVAVFAYFVLPLLKRKAK